MAIDGKIRDKNYNMKLTEKQQKCQHYHLVQHKYLTGEEILPFNQSQMTEQTKFTYSPLWKAFKKQKLLKIKEDKELKICSLSTPNNN